MSSTVTTLMLATTWDIWKFFLPKMIIRMIRGIKKMIRLHSLIRCSCTKYPSS
ncbi:Hypothetical predicted protein [Olea europaea subsp. europaea]|uniref:Uncharacterized protein n=1 Tax=Olea europaea subsp. europaea TaxID=158383 RepID=A0A8S0TQY3_OLEEU|nr:Hypothetical predicted protein [Olea europaea subsp. europaea]